MKGIFRNNPPKPRYSSTWNVEQVLQFIKSLGPSSDLSLKMLSLKTVCLLAICAPKRVSEIAVFSLKYFENSNNFVRFYVNKVTKTRKTGDPVDCVEYQEFVTDLLICPVTTVRCYLEETAHLRNSEDRLFLSFRKPHKAVGTATLARWLVNMLVLAGIDARIFKAHSFRGASTSYSYNKGLPMRDILNAACWSEKSNTFKQFYYKSIDNSMHYSTSVLHSFASRCVVVLHEY